MTIIYLIGTHDNTYKIADLNNPRTGGVEGGQHYDPNDSFGNKVINYATQDNYYARGRTNNSGNAKISGNVVADGDQPYNPPGGTEITRGGPGSRTGNYCGITVGFHNPKGDFFIATEDKRPGVKGSRTYLCSTDKSDHPLYGDCGGLKSIGSTYNRTINLSWHADVSNGHVTYCGRTDGMSGCGPGPGLLGKVTDPTVTASDKRIVMPGNRLAVGSGGIANDPTRMRVDGATRNVQISTINAYDESM